MPFAGKYELPGITAAYALPEGQVVELASGLADKESRTNMTPDTRMLADHVYDPQFAAEAKKMTAALDTNPYAYFKPRVKKIEWLRGDLPTPCSTT